MLYLIRARDIHGEMFVCLEAYDSEYEEFNVVFGQRLMDGNIPYEFMEKVTEHFALFDDEPRIQFSF